MKLDCFVKGGMVVSPYGTYRGNIGIKGEEIVLIDTYDGHHDAEEVIDAKGLHVIPGIIDTHTHIGWPDWPLEQDLGPTTKAAAAGGVTTIMHYVMAPESLVEGIREQKSAFERGAYIDGGFHGMIFSEKNIEEIPTVSEMGVRSFKFFLPYKGPEAVPPAIGIDDGIVYQGFKQIARLDPPGLALFHAENIEIFFQLKDQFLKEGLNDVDWHDTRPNFVEIESIRKIVFYARETGCPIYVVHMSVREGPYEVARARAEGVNITAETCPQYLTLTKRAHRVLGKVNPPLRDTKDNEALWEGLRTGMVECLGSDHAPCATKHKQEFWSAVVGFAGVQTTLPVMLSEGVNKGRITLEKLVEIACYNNARKFGLLPKKGTLQVGSDADLVLIDLDKEFSVRASDLYHISDFTPFEGMTIKGVPVLTMVRGKVVMKENKIIGEPRGKFVPAYGIQK